MTKEIRNTRALLENDETEKKCYTLDIKTLQHSTESEATWKIVTATGISSGLENPNEEPIPLKAGVACQISVSDIYCQFFFDKHCKLARRSCSNRRRWILLSTHSRPQNWYSC